MEDVKGYCQQCGKIVNIGNPEKMILTNCDRVYRGKCPICQGRIIKKRGD